MTAHVLHRKQAVAYRINRSRRYWRWHVKLNRIFLRLEMEKQIKNTGGKKQCQQLDFQTVAR